MQEKLEKNPGLQNLKFLRFEADLDFSRPWFSEIKVQIKRPILVDSCCLNRVIQLIAVKNNKTDANVKIVIQEKNMLENCIPQHV